MVESINDNNNGGGVTSGGGTSSDEDVNSGGGGIISGGDVPSDDDVNSGGGGVTSGGGTASDVDININTTPIRPESDADIKLLTTESEIDGDTTIRVSNFESDDAIRLSGDYPQNYVDIPKFNLSEIIVINEYIANFNFIVSLKDSNTGVIASYASSKVFDELNEKYSNSNPLPVNYLIHSRKLVVIDITPFKELTEKMRRAELGINLNRSEINGNIEVTRNVFTYSNYKAGAGGTLVATPTYDLTELIKYISWVVSKPSGNYDERLLPANELGDWGGSVPATPDDDEASIDTTNDTDTNQYPPIGRAGTQDGEEVLNQQQRWVWNIELDRWQTEKERYDIDETDTNDNGGGTSSDSQNGGGTSSDSQNGGGTSSDSQNGGGDPS